MLKWAQLSAIHLEDVKTFNYPSSNNSTMKWQHGKSARKCDKMRSPLEVHGSSFSSAQCCGGLACHTCATCVSLPAHMVDWSPAQLWVVNTPPTRGIDPSAVHVCLGRLWGCSGSCNLTVMTVLTAAQLRNTQWWSTLENPENRHPNSNNSVSPWQLMTLLVTAHREEDGSCQHMKSKSSNCTVRPALLVKVMTSGTVDKEKHQTKGKEWAV